LAKPVREPRRGDVWLVALGAAKRGELDKSRPALIVSVDDIVTGGQTELFVVVPLSSSRKGSSLRPIVPRAAGLDRASIAVCRGVRALSRTRLLAWGAVCAWSVRISRHTRALRFAPNQLSWPARRQRSHRASG
jgi:mRNA interferase MazF